MNTTRPTPARRSSRGRGRAAGSALLLGALFMLPGAFSATGCQKRDVCEEVAGPCLALRVTGAAEPGTYDELVTALSRDGVTALRSGSTAGDITLPLTLRVIPPEGVLPSTVRRVSVSGQRSGAVVASAQTADGFAWADDEHLTITLELQAPTTPDPDGGMPPVGDMGVPGTDLARPPADLAGPPADLAVPPLPSLNWKTEASPPGLNRSLYDVWIGSGPQVLAVGAGGLVLARQTSGAWAAELTGITSPLQSVFGLPGSGVWATGQSPGAWRRDAMSGKWSADTMGLALAMDGTLWSVATGATPGELWAGGDGGKVWHRSGTVDSGTWKAEQVLPADVTVTSVAYADGAVFAVGRRGYAAVRKDSAPATPWTSYQYPALNATNTGLYGVWGYDRNSAVAVGSKGLLVRFTGGTWQTTTQTIDTAGNEFNAVWGTSPSRVWAVGYNGLVVFSDGTKSTQLHSDGTQSLYGIFGSSEANIYVVGATAVGGSLILHGQP